MVEVARVYEPEKKHSDQVHGIVFFLMVIIGFFRWSKAEDWGILQIA